MTIHSIQTLDQLRSLTPFTDWTKVEFSNTEIIARDLFRILASQDTVILPTVTFHNSKLIGTPHEIAKIMEYSSEKRSHHNLTLDVQGFDYFENVHDCPAVQYKLVEKLIEALDGILLTTDNATPLFSEEYVEDTIIHFNDELPSPTAIVIAN